MYLQHFGLTHPPLGKELCEPWDDGALAALAQRFDWLLKSPGIGLLTGEPGVGKTAALRKLTRSLNPHRYLVLYQAETDFGRVDLYRGLARALGVEPSYRRAQLWRDIKQRVHELADGKQITPIWIILKSAEFLPGLSLPGLGLAFVSVGPFLGHPSRLAYLPSRASFILRRLCSMLNPTHSSVNALKRL